MGEFKSYRDLEVWKRAMLLAKQIYLHSSQFPPEEKFGLVNQMRRAAVSVPSNLAEGHARSGAAEFLRFISIALGSLAELETQVLLSADLGFLHNDHKDKLMQEMDKLGRMMRGLQKSLQNRRNV